MPALGMLHDVDRDFDQDVVLEVLLEGIHEDVEWNCLWVVCHDRVEVQPVI